jgi:hypothetical protein
LWYLILKTSKVRWINNIIILIVDSDICNNQIRLNGRQQKSSVYCSSCSTYIDGQISAPIVQLELPSLTQLTGIFLQNHNQNQEKTSVRKEKIHFIVSWFWFLFRKSIHIFSNIVEHKMGLGEPMVNVDNEKYFKEK